MAKGKTSSGKKYVSKGEVPTVNRKFKNSIRRENRRLPSVDSLIKRKKHRDFIIYKNSPPHLAEKYAKEEQELNIASQLYYAFYHLGATWEGCVQAVKTDWVPSFKNKYISRAKDKGLDVPKLPFESLDSNKKK